MDDVNYPREAGEVVEEALNGLEHELYSSPKEERRAIYKMILSHLNYMMLIDGGPTAGIEVLEAGLAELRDFETRRSVKKIGPFLSDAQRELLTMTPGRYLRQDIEFTGPGRWTIKDSWNGWVA